MRLHKLPVIIFLIILSIKSLYAKDLKIERIVGNEIITNIDVENQFNLLIALNEDLKNIEKDKMYYLILIGKEQNKLRKKN